MEFLFNEFVRLRAKREGISENEAYLRYAERNRKPARRIKPRKPFGDQEDKDHLL
jgi:hypothetical protein